MMSQTHFLFAICRRFRVEADNDGQIFLDLAMKARTALDTRLPGWVKTPPKGHSQMTSGGGRKAVEINPDFRLS